MYILCTVYVREKNNDNNNKKKKTCDKLVSAWMQQMNVRRIVERIAQQKVSLLIEMSLYAQCASKCVIKLCAKTKWCYNNDKSQSYQRQRRLLWRWRRRRQSRRNIQSVKQMGLCTFTAATVSVDQRSLGKIVWISLCTLQSNELIWLSKHSTFIEEK